MIQSLPAKSTGAIDERSQEIVFLFTGQGAQYPGMGQQLFETHPTFRQTLLECEEILADALDRPLLEVMYPDLCSSSNLSSNTSSQLNEAGYAQPALFSLEYALAKLWESYGVVPTAVMGHSLGEYVAACVTGVFSLEAGLTLVARRGKLMQTLRASGSMVAVAADEVTVEQVLAGYCDVAIAAYNSPNSLTLSGDRNAIEAAVNRLKNAGIRSRPLATSHAYHSALVEPILADFEQAAKCVLYSPPRLQFASSLNGKVIEAAAKSNNKTGASPRVDSAAYWVEQTRQPVRFAQGLDDLIAQGHRLFVEVGPAPVLSRFGQQLESTHSLSHHSPDCLWLPSLQREHNNYQTILSSLGQILARASVSATSAMSSSQSVSQNSVQPYLPSDSNSISQAQPSRPQALELQVSKPQPRRLEILAMLQQYASKSLGHQTPVDPTISLIELGADSINLFEMMQALEQQFGIQLSIGQIFEDLTTLDALADYLDRALAPNWRVSNAEQILDENKIDETEIDENKIDESALIGDRTHLTATDSLNIVTSQMVNREAVASQAVDFQLEKKPEERKPEERKPEEKKPEEKSPYSEVRSLSSRQTMQGAANIMQKQLGIMQNVMLQQLATMQRIRQSAAIVRTNHQDTNRQNTSRPNTALSSTDLSSTDCPNTDRQSEQRKNGFSNGSAKPTSNGKAPDGTNGYASNGHSNGKAKALQNNSVERSAAIGSSTATDRNITNRNITNRNIEPQVDSAIATFPLSAAQQQMWWVETLSTTASNVYLIPSAVKLEGTLDVAALEQSLNAIIARHESLRTNFVVEEGTPQQIVRPERKLHLSVVEGTGCLSEEAIQQQVYRLVASRFDLANDLLMRGQIVRWPNGQAALILVIHHLVADAWSVGVLIREWLALYPSFCKGNAVKLPSLPIRYGDFVLWQQKALTKGRDKNVAYWRSQLVESPVLALPTDFPRPAQPTFRGQTHHQTLSPELTAALKQLSKTSGTTLFMTLLSAYSILLSRYSGQQELLIGSTFADRQAAEVRSLIGLFLNTLIFRIDLTSNPTIQTLLSRVKRAAIDAFAHPHIPFVELAAERSPDKQGADWFQAMFILQTTARPTLSLPDLDLSIVPVHGKSAKCDLALWMEESNGRLRAEWEYNCDLFAASTIEGIANCFEQLLMQLVESFQPGCRQQTVAQIPLLSAAEQQRLLARAIAPSANDNPIQPVHQQFEAQAARSPKATALEHVGKRWNYQTLNERANQIAHYLQSIGIEKRSLVAICLERSPELIATLLAVLKVGAAYLPMDSKYPAERLAQMLEDAQPAVLVTKASIQQQLNLNVAQVVDVDNEAISQQANDNLNQTVDLEQIAYVIYTSGSTGKPKGVELTHRGLANFVQQSTAQYGFRTDERVLQFASISFDAAVEEIYLTLCSGSTLVLRDDEMIASSERFCQISSQQQLSVWDLPTAFWHRLTLDIAQGVATLPESLRLVIIGGEKVQPQIVHTWQQISRGRNVRLLNTYGPTEATVVATCYEVDDSWQYEAGVEVPIGCPLGNMESYVLDAQRQLVPLGVVGELYIGGPGLAAGYLNRPELTAERFVAHPFKKRERLYRTGDLAKMSPEGCLHYFGRADDQVKIRGFRVELGEVESAISEYPGVKEVVVLAKEGESGSFALCAYVVCQPGAVVEGRSLRRVLKQTLPEYMVPSYMVTLDELPLSRTGKVDRKALPYPDSSDLAVADEYTAPRSDIEAELAELWSSLLDVSPVGVETSFFELGGHSLLAMQLLSSIQQQFQVQLSLSDLFAQPTVAHLASMIQSGNHQAIALPDIPVIERSGPLPVSIAQQRIWLLEQMGELGATYHIALRLEIRGALELDILNRSLALLVERHESLRTTFLVQDSQPVQVIHDSMPIQVETAQAEKSDLDLDSNLDRAAQLYAEQPFDLETGPLLRVKLFQVDSQRQMLVFAVHHIIADGWSVGVLIQEMMRLYPALLVDRQPETLHLPVQPADFAQWQREWLQGDQLQQQLDYWKQQLAGATASLSLPTDRPRQSEQSYKGAVLTATLSKNLTQQLNRFSQQTGTSLYMTLLSGFGVLLHRYSGQSDILIGSPIANRAHPQVQHLIGLFLNTLVLRLDCTGSPCFADFLQQARQVTLDAYAHQDVPFERLLENLPPEQQRSASPWFQVMFILQNAHRYELDLEGIEVDAEMVDMGVAKFDITLSMEEVGGELVGSWEYNSDLFDRATIERMAAHFEQLLHHLVNNVQQPIDQLLLLSAAEQQQMQSLAVRPSAVAEPLRPVHEWFERQVDMRPEATALVAGSTTWCYQQLNQRANQIARHLQSVGVGRNQLVALCLERSPELIAMLLAVLKLGAAYLPMDPTYPTERLAQMLEDAQVKVMVTRQNIQQQLGFDVAQVVDVDDALIQSYASENLDQVVDLDQSAYVIYTSGSTGKPKGVELTHRGLAHFVQQSTIQYGFGGDERVLQFASISFDAAVEEIYLTLCSGSTLVLRDDEMIASSDRFCHESTLQKLSVWDLPTAFWHRLTLDIAQGLAKLPESLRIVIIGGEKVQPQVVQTWQQLVQGSGIRLLNTYGPTEATVVATFYEVDTSWQYQAGVEVPIGRAIGNMESYVLDEQRQIVPLGVVGELYLGGPGLAAGYLNRPELTAERFVTHPFKQNERLYRTGDLAKISPDGCLHYFGRADDQVKIRGFRVELGEVEALVQRLSAVRECAAIAQPDNQGTVQLIAYVTADDSAGGSVPTSQTLRKELLAQVPNYLVPALFMLVDEIPLTPAGKLNRKALPLPQPSDWIEPSEYVAPRSATEAALTFMVAEVLGLERIGVTDDFFALGGNSLAAMRVLARIRSMFDREISLRSLFSNPTVAALAEALEQTQEVIAEEKGIPPCDRTQPIPLSLSQERFWFLYQLEGPSATYNLPIALRLEGELNVSALEHCFTQVVQRHEVLRTRFVPSETGAVQIVQPAETVPIAQIDLLALSERSQAAAIEQHVQQAARYPFDLSKEPLIQVTLLQLGDRRHVLVITMHHIIADGWSMGVLVQEVMAAYPAYCQGKVPDLAPLPVQYADYSQWQQQQIDNPAFEARLDQWAEQLATAPPLLDLPTDRPRPAVQTFRGGLVRAQLPSELTRSLKQFGQQRQKTLFMTLMTAFVALLHRYSRQSELVIGTPIAGRSHAELEALIGCFVNTLPLRFELGETIAFDDLLRQVEVQSLSAFGNQDIPFEKLVEKLSRSRDLSYLPLSQVMFVLQNAPLEALKIPDMDWEVIDSHSGTARFDLTLSMQEVSDTLIGDWEYNSDLFDRETIERMAAQFEQLIGAAIAQIKTPIAKLPMLTAAEKQLHTQVNQTQVDLPLKCAHHWFAAQAEKTPAAIALAGSDLHGAEVQLTYAQLDQRANQLAHYLQAKGVEPEQLVGICLPRCIDFAIAMLAVWKAGGAFVPFDPTYPAERLTYMANDAQIKVLIESDSVSDRLPDLAEGVQRLPLDRLDADLAQQPSSAPQSVTSSYISPHNLAYVIYTSGSTGQPKGVLVEHTGIGNLAFAQISAFQIAPESCVLQMASFSFDASISEMLMALLAGAQLRIGNYEQIMGQGEKLRQQGISHLTIPPSALSVLAIEDLATVGHLIVAGEACPADLAAKWSNRAGFYNAYGPTEATVCATIANCTNTYEKPSIGGPIQNVQIYVVDRHMQPVPVGVPGELLIGGIGLARGYLNRPEKTAQAFISSPFNANERLYRTGDLVRLRPDGQLDYLGRIDHQVKLRGQRLELGEIVNLLRNHPSVKEATVLLQAVASGGEILTAYVVPQTLPDAAAAIAKQTLIDTLQSFAAEHLPKYMVPTAFVLLEQMPLTPNGKIDRQSLPLPTARQTSDYVAPRNLIETALAQMWSELLGVEKVGITDSFFDLGGHSLLALQVLSRIQRQFGANVQLQPLFEQPTIAQLSELILAEQIAQVEDSLLEQLLSEIEALSDDAAQALLLAP